jgi:hypothetical protein
VLLVTDPREELNVALLGCKGAANGIHDRRGKAGLGESVDASVLPGLTWLRRLARRRR